MASELAAYVRFAAGLPGFLRGRVTAADARAIVRARLEGRDEAFLRLARMSIFGRQSSPYRRLLDATGCSYGDLERLVRGRGLEPALRALHAAGVYVTFDEFKGRRPIVRGATVIPVTARDFDNPLLARHYAAATGGTTGAAARVLIDLDHVAATAPLHALAWDAHGLTGAPWAIWRSILPGVSGVNNVLRGVRLGNVPQRWFTPVAPHDLAPSWRARLATACLVGVGRAAGVRIPRPEPMPLAASGAIARWLAGAAAREGRAVLSTFVSLGARVALAAVAEGIDLSGATVLGGGEPPSPAKVRAIAASGARFVPTYSFAEAGPVGIGCATPADPTDVHFFRDCLAIVPIPLDGDEAGEGRHAFLFTTLLPTAPKILLNVESDDAGILETRRCGCPLEAAGYGEHIRQVRSLRKLTGEGVTVAGADLSRITEEVLPARFGGSPLDYQFVEEEDAAGFTRVPIFVAPGVGPVDERAVVDAVLAALGGGAPSADLARAVWQQAGTLYVRRAEPIWTARGKLMPRHAARAAPPSAPAGGPAAAPSTATVSSPRADAAAGRPATSSAPHGGSAAAAEYRERRP
jgi:hypothetical protein